jgi:non-reducing end alpha-L-arabinofuranosidase
MISIQATTACCTSSYIQHDDGDNRVVLAQITSGSSTADKADATWIVQPGLSDSSCISFESANDSGQYLKYLDFELYLDPDDGSSQFADDATFCMKPGNSGQGHSFQSVSYPSMYIRHYDWVLYIASDGGSDAWDNSYLWPDDSTWLVSAPWG